jgi:hypothetical protein
MQVWQDTVSTALVGTERQPPVVTPTGQPIDALLQATDAADRERQLMSVAGLLTLWRRAGLRLAIDRASLPAPAEPDDQPRCTARAAQFLRQMLDRLYESVLPEWLGALAQTGRRAPEEYLPELLELGHMQPALRLLITPVIGRRGRWLAAQNPDWHYAVPGDDETVWQTGAHDERLFMLRRLRATDPARGRELVASTWKEETAQDRTSFVGALAAGLSMADEPFLEAALDDRSKDARRAAAELLSRLPESRLTQRMIERAGATLRATFKRGRLIGSNLVEVTFPTEITKDMLRDGIEPKPPAIVKRMGEKAWQLTQIVNAVPPSHWSETWGKTPREIMRAVEKSDWRSSLLEGWALAAQRYGDIEWAEALLEDWPSPDAVMEGLIEALPVERREAYALRLLQTDRDPFNTEHHTLAVLQACQQVWSIALGRAVLGALRKHVTRQQAVDWRLHTLFSLLGSNLPVELLNEAGRDWPEWAAPTVDKFMALLQFRHDMLTALREQDEEEQRT